MNTKKAFTLIEMMVSIGIIVILSSVFTTTLMIYIDKANSASYGVDSHLNKYKAAESSVNDLRGVAGVPAVVVPVTYTVTFDSQSGSSVSSITGLAANATISAPSSPTLAGQSFVAWYKDSSYTTAWNFGSDKVTGNITLYAKWTASTPANYTVTLDSQGGSTVAAVTAAPNTTISALPTPTKTANTFGGWYKQSGCLTAWNYSTDTVTGDVTLYAKWTPSNTALAPILIFGNSWGSGPYISQYTLAVNNTGTTQITNWAVKITVPAGSTVSGWNATFSVSGTILTITADSNNRTISAGGSINNIGFQLSTPSSFTASSPVATGS